MGYSVEGNEGHSEPSYYHPISFCWGTNWWTEHFRGNAGYKSNVMKLMSAENKNRPWFVTIGRTLTLILVQLLVMKSTLLKQCQPSSKMVQQLNVFTIFRQKMIKEEGEVFLKISMFLARRHRNFERLLPILVLRLIVNIRSTVRSRFKDPTTLTNRWI